MLTYKKNSIKWKIFFKKLELSLVLIIFIKLMYKFNIPKTNTYINNFLLRKNIDNNVFFNNKYIFSTIKNRLVFSPFILGIGPFVNASIIVDLINNLFLSKEKKEKRQEKIFYYKRILCIFFIAFEIIYLINFLQPSFYNINYNFILIIIISLIVGFIIILIVILLIDKSGIGNGISVILFCTLIFNLLNNLRKTLIIWNKLLFAEILILYIFSYIICFFQKILFKFDIISAQQLYLLNRSIYINPNIEFANIFFHFNQKNGLLIGFNQVGVLPIINATNFFLFFLYVKKYNLKFNFIFNTLINFILITTFIYLYTLIFWNPKKIINELKKDSVIFVNLSENKLRYNYLKKIIFIFSILNAVYLFLILFLYKIFSNFFIINLLSKISIFSILVLITITLDIIRTIKISMLSF